MQQQATLCCLIKLLVQDVKAQLVWTQAIKAQLLIEAALPDATLLVLAVTAHSGLQLITGSIAQQPPVNANPV